MSRTADPVGAPGGAGFPETTTNTEPNGPVQAACIAIGQGFQLWQARCAGPESATRIPARSLACAPPPEPAGQRLVMLLQTAKFVIGRFSDARNPAYRAIGAVGQGEIRADADLPEGLALSLVRMNCPRPTGRISTEESSKLADALLEPQSWSVRRCSACVFLVVLEARGEDRALVADHGGPASRATSERTFEHVQRNMVLIGPGGVAHSVGEHDPAFLTRIRSRMTWEEQTS